MNRTFTEKQLSYLFLSSSVFLFIGCFDLDMGYYFFLRVYIFMTGIYGLLRFREDVMLAFAFLVMSVLFNPVFMVYMFHKQHWIVIDIVFAFILLNVGLQIRK